MRVFNPPSDVPARDSQAGLHKNPLALRGAPILLTSEITTLAAGAQDVPFPTTGLQPENRVGYWIDEVRMIVGQDGAFDTSLILPAAISLYFATGKYQVTKAAMPSMLFGPVFGFDEAMADPFAGSIFADFRWPLPKPMYLGPGDILQCRASRDATLASSVALRNVALAYVGRACAPGEEPPKTTCVPYVAHYLHPYTSTYSQTFDEFKNPFLSDWMIQRLISRTVYRYAVATGDALLTPSQSGNALGGGSNGQVMGYGVLPATTNLETYVSMRVADSMGYEIVPNFSPIGTIVDPIRSAWTFNRAISAREKLQVSFQTTQVTSNYDTYLSVIGYREEAV